QRRWGVAPEGTSDVGQRGTERRVLVLPEISGHTGCARERGHDPGDGEDPQHRCPVRGEEGGGLHEEAHEALGVQRIPPTPARSGHYRWRSGGRCGTILARTVPQRVRGDAHLIPEAAKPCTK